MNIQDTPLPTSDEPRRQVPADCRILLASHNKGKLAEIQSMLEGTDIEVILAGDLDLPEPVETEDTLEGNARLKAHAAAKATGMIALADDSGLELPDLDGMPGVYTADWAEIEGADYGQEGRDYKIAADRIIRELKNRGIEGSAPASFRTVLCIAWPDGYDRIVDGDIPGAFISAPRGNKGHDLDPYFLPDGHEKTFGEMELEEKNALSCRAIAVRKFVKNCIETSQPSLKT